MPKKNMGDPPAASGAARVWDPAQFPVREGEDPWTADELTAVRDELASELTRLRADVVRAEEDLARLMTDHGDGAGDDQADAGAKTFDREQEMSLANNSRDLLLQTERAMERLDAERYGACETCGQPIGKLRLQAFPRATLCVSCKQKQERR